MTVLSDQNNNEIQSFEKFTTHEIHLQTEENLNLNHSDEELSSTNEISLSKPMKPKKKSLTLNQLESRGSNEHVRPKQLNLNIQFSSDSSYPIPKSIRLHCDDDKSDDRKNAEKRIHLYERKR